MMTLFKCIHHDSHPELPVAQTLLSLLVPVPQTCLHTTRGVHKNYNMSASCRTMLIVHLHVLDPWSLTGDRLQNVDTSDSSDMTSPGAVWGDLSCGCVT